MAVSPDRLPTTVEKGALGGPKDSITTLPAYGGSEVRNINWPRARRKFNISYGLNEGDFETVRDFYIAQRGMANPFLFKDWSDFKGVDEVIGTGTGAQTAFQLVRLYDAGTLTFSRPIKYPVAATIVIKVNGVTKTLTTHYTVGAGGVITFLSAPAAAAVVTASFEFDVPVRFNTDILQISMQTPTAGAIGAVELLEVFE